jgi:sulfur carrier protein ThiS
MNDEVRDPFGSRTSEQHMTAIVRPLGMLKTYIGNLKETSVESGFSVRETLTLLGINPDLVAGVFINNEQQTKDYIIQDGDEVKIMAVIGGG